TDAYYRVLRDAAQVSGDYATGAFTDSTRPDGTYLYAVHGVDAAGNVSAAGATLSLTIDTAAPGVPNAPDLQAASDSGSSATDNLTATPVVLHAPANGSSFLPGTTPVNVTATDLAGNASNGSFDVTLVDSPFIVRGGAAAYAFTGAAGSQTLAISAGLVTFVS